MSDFQCIVGTLCLVWLVGLFLIAGYSGSAPKDEE